MDARYVSGGIIIIGFGFRFGCLGFYGLSIELLFLRLYVRV